MSLGQDELQRMLDVGELELCAPELAGAQRLIGKAEIHHVTAEKIATEDPETALDALHSGNRKALDAVLLVRGLRATKDGGHIASRAAVESMFGRATVAVYDTVRRLRHEGDYQSYGHDAHPDDVIGNLPASKNLVSACSKVLADIPVFVSGRT